MPKTNTQFYPPFGKFSRYCLSIAVDLITKWWSQKLLQSIRKQLQSSKLRLDKKKNILIAMRKSWKWSWTSTRRKMEIWKRRMKKRFFSERSFRRRSTKASKLMKRKSNLDFSSKVNSMDYTHFTETCKQSMTERSATFLTSRNKINFRRRN